MPSRTRRALRATRPWPTCGRALCRRGSKACALAAHRLERQAERDIGLLQEPARVVDGEHAERKRRRRAVDEGRGVLRAHREVGLKARLPDRLAGRQALALVDDLGLLEAADGAGHVGERREVAGGADRALLRDDRMQAGVEEGDEAFDELELRARIVRGEGVGAQQHHRPRGVLGEGLADTGRVRQHGLALVFGHVADEDALILEQADAGVEGVHQRRVVVHPMPIDIGPRRRHLVARRGMQRRLLEAAARARPGDAHDVADLELCPVDLHRHEVARRRRRLRNSGAGGGAQTRLSSRVGGRKRLAIPSPLAVSSSYGSVGLLKHGEPR